MGCMPTVAMLLVQIGFAGMNLLSKMALDNGMSPYVLVTYRSLIAAVFLSPFAVYFERCACLKTYSLQKSWLKS